MSNEKSDVLDRLRLIYSSLPEDQKPLFSEVATTIKALREQIDNPLPEAPASATAKVIRPDSQMEWLVTVREVNAGKLLISGLPGVEAELTKLGYIAMDAYIDQRRTERNATNGAQPVTPPPVQTNGGGHKTFQAETLSITVNDGKPYFKVKGGKFSKFGIMVWPEVLEAAGWRVNDLDPMQTYSLTGHEAVYSTKEDGKPEKVIELRRE